MANIREIADRVQNIYFQDYKSSAEFFELSDFVFFVGSSYAEMLAAEFDKARAEAGNDVVEFAGDLVSVKEIETKKDSRGFYAELPESIMSFPYDARNSGIQNILPAREKAFEYIRSTTSQAWMDNLMPATNKVFWSLMGNRIDLFSNLRTPPEYSTIIYVPAISNTVIIADGRVNTIIKSTISMLRESAKNFIIKENNDGNLNKTERSESDENLNKR